MLCAGLTWVVTLTHVAADVAVKWIFGVVDFNC